jgi:hypothetical protein
MKPSWEWTEDDLLSMRSDQAEESLSLEFKRSQALERSDKNKSELSKDISAFANSTGGDIVYGVAQAGKPPSKFGDIDEGIDAEIVSPEWVEQVLNSNIQPKIEGLRIHSIELPTLRPGRYVYAVHVPTSYKVHQAHDKRYYKRFNFESIPMDDYEIRDLRNRRERPELKVYCEVAKARLTSFSKLETWPTFFLGIRPGPVRIPSFDLNVALINSGARAAKHAQAILSFDNLRIRKVGGLAARIDDLRGGKPTLQWTSFESVVHAETALRIMELSFTVLNLKENCTIKTEVVAEDVPRVTHEYKFHSSGLILANFKDTDGTKLMVSLDQMESMFKQPKS